MFGILVSILLHELGHAFAGRQFDAHVSYIELTGLGGVAQFERSLPRSVLARTVIYLAGPAVNLALWLGFGALADQARAGGLWVLASPLGTLAFINLILLIFNLLPAYPLDGGFDLGSLAGPPPRPDMVGAHCRLPRPRRGRRRRLAGLPAQHLPLHRPLPRHVELAAAAKRRRVGEVGSARNNGRYPGKCLKYGSASLSTRAKAGRCVRRWR